MLGKTKEITKLLKNCDYFNNYINRNRSYPRSWELVLKTLKDDNPDKVCRELKALNNRSLNNRRNSNNIEYFNKSNNNIIYYFIILFLIYILFIYNA
tara:strand:+ start:1032 stop:1322 length:291 start_codon:yes stop_codon:yes gene_type:complete